MAEAKRDPERTRLVALVVILAVVAVVAGVRFWGRTGIAGDRIYIEFADAPRRMWGWNGGTF